MNKNYSGFKRYYQPIFSSSSSQIHHYEMLVRRQDGSSAFQDIIELEKLGKVHELDLANVAYASNQINKGGVEYPVAINVSSNSLMKSGFFDDMCNILRKCKRRDLISIELTETGVTPDLPLFRQYFEILQDEGIKISADDFASGFMNERVVQSLPFDNIKIDRVLINQILDNPSAAERVKKLVEYAKDNCISVTAEFVDSQDVLNKIIELGVDYAQGFYLGEPSPTFSSPSNKNTSLVR